MPVIPGAAVPQAPLENVPPGQQTSTAQGGDFYLTHGDHLLSKAIRVGQGLRFRGPDRVYAYYNHAGMFVDDRGAIVEALPNGVVRRSISAYTPRQYTVVGVGKVADERDRQQMVAVAQDMVGVPFGWVTMASNLVHVLTGSRLGMFVDGHTVCSGLVARCLQRTSLVYLTDPDSVSPADLAKLFDVRPLVAEETA
jgi:uncharacterized protein YycO